jgi:hypothetical protein
VNVWRCRRIQNGQKCGQLNLARKQKCTLCGKPRPKKRQPAHRAVLATITYEDCVRLFGEYCGICGRPAGERRLHRDHEHKGAGHIRGLLCFRCNSALRSYMTLDWLRAAVAYLECAETRKAAALLDRQEAA